jgi:hypothetical protein
MSAILNTLKKLEEEKSVFEQSLDVQDLALHNEFGSTSAFVQVSQKRNNLILIVSISVFLIISVSLFFYFKSTQTPIGQDSVSNSFFDIPKSSDLNEVKLPKGASVSGISMNQISGGRDENREREPVLEQSPQADPAIQENLISVDNVSNQAKVAEVVKLISSGGSLESSLTQTLSPSEFEKRTKNIDKDSKEEVVTSKVRKEINIRKEDIKKTNEEFLSLIEKTQIDEAKEQVPSKPQERNPLNIPFLKLKGIIYFTEGNPANYIFVSSAEQNNVKLKVGESIMGAMLQSIQSSRAIFTRNGKTGFVEMGQ